MKPREEGKGRSLMTLIIGENKEALAKLLGEYAARNGESVDVFYLQYFEGLLKAGGEALVRPFEINRVVNSSNQETEMATKKLDEERKVRVKTVYDEFRTIMDREGVMPEHWQYSPEVMSAAVGAIQGAQEMVNLSKQLNDFWEWVRQKDSNFYAQINTEDINAVLRASIIFNTANVHGKISDPGVLTQRNFLQRIGKHLNDFNLFEGVRGELTAFVEREKRNWPDIFKDMEKNVNVQTQITNIVGSLTPIMNRHDLLLMPTDIQKQVLEDALNTIRESVSSKRWEKVAKGLREPLLEQAGNENLKVVINQVFDERRMMGKLSDTKSIFQRMKSFGGRAIRTITRKSPKVDAHEHLLNVSPPGSRPASTLGSPRESTIEKIKSTPTSNLTTPIQSPKQSRQQQTAKEESSQERPHSKH